MHRPSGPPIPIDLDSPFFASPDKIPSLEQLERASPLPRKAPHRISKVENSCSLNGETLSLEPPRIWIEQPCTRSENDSSYLIDGLTPELILEIMSYLPFDQVKKLRLVCRRFASIGAFENLPQSYWRSRFCIGQEADFIFPDLSNARDWGSIFLTTMRFLQNADQSMVNRKRIRDLLEPIAAIVELEGLFKAEPHGSIVSPDPERGNGLRICNGTNTKDEWLPLGMVTGFSGQIQARSDGSLEQGCRVFHRRTQALLPLPSGRDRRILVSTIEVGTRRFISGIFLKAESNSPVHGLGYRITASEQQVLYTSELQGIAVAFCAEGLIGVKFTFQDSSATDWLGNIDYAGVAFGRLSIDQGSSSSYLVANLDNYKIVSLGLGMTLVDSGTSLAEVESGMIVDSLPPSHNGANAKLIQSALWTPQFPSTSSVTFSDILPLGSFQTFDPLINIDFGGAEGTRLGALTAFTCYMSLKHHPLLGIEVSYSDGQTIMFGLKAGCKLTFFVNGQNGERINQVGIVEGQDSPDDELLSLFGLQVSTNRGRTASFIPLRHRISETSTRILEPPPGNIITGLVATESDAWSASTGLSHPSQGMYGGLTRIGIQSQVPHGHDHIMTPVYTESHEFSNHASDNEISNDIAYSYLIDSAVHGNYQTFASLQNVQKIIASTGKSGGSRSPCFISGLKFEYFDDLHQPPSVVGQWMNETGSVLELSVGERVQSLTVWLAPVDFSTSSRGLEICQVTAIRIDTSHGRNMTFHASQTLPLSLGDRIDQYQCDLGEEMVALSWILNVKADRLRAVFSKATRPTQTMMPELSAPYDHVPKLYFMMPNLDGSLEPVTIAKAYFQNRRILGLAFSYPSGKISRIGITDTGTCATAIFPDKSRVVGLSVAYSKGSEPVEIDFEVESDADVDSEPAKLRLYVESPGDTLSDDPTDPHRWDVWWKDELAAKEGIQQPTFHRRDFIRPPKSKLAGIFVACQGVDTFGALYEPENQK